MNEYPEFAALNTALVSAGLNPALATLTGASPLSELVRLAAIAGVTPSDAYKAAESI